MLHGWIVTLNLISIVTGSVAALLLYWGSLGVPWKLRSWGGETDIEKRYERTRRIMARVGVPCVFITAACQIVAVVLS